MDVVVLISGTGSNLRALLEAARHADYPARIVAIGADRDADGLALGEEFGIPTFIVPFDRGMDREAWGAELIAAIDPFRPELVVLSGLMRLVPGNVIDRYAPMLLNTHPAYLPEFPGAHGVRDALAAGVSQTGASIIIVDRSVDGGPIVVQERVAIQADDTEATLHERIKPVERRLLIDTVRAIATNTINLKEFSQP